MADNESDDPNAQPPKPASRLKIVKEKRGRITAQMYEALARAFLESSSRSMRGLARDTGLSEDTCIKAINLGWPERGWPSLRERATLYDKQKAAQTDVPPMTPQQIVDVRRFIEMREENLGLLRSFRALAARIANRINAALGEEGKDNAATATRTAKRSRVVQVRQGKRMVERIVHEDVELPPYLPALAGAARDIGQLAFTAGEQEKRWIKIEAPEGEAPMESGWEDMTDEQLDYVARTGKLPPGYTREGLRSKK